MIRRIEIDRDKDGGFDIRAIGHEEGQLLATGLQGDEALGVVASWIFRGPKERPHYMRTLLEEARWYRKYCPEDLTAELRQALRDAGEPQEEPKDAPAAQEGGATRPSPTPRPPSSSASCSRSSPSSLLSLRLLARARRTRESRSGTRTST